MLILHVDAASERLLGPVAGLVARGRGEGREEMGLRQGDLCDWVVDYVALPEGSEALWSCNLFSAGGGSQTVSMK